MPLDTAAHGIAVARLGVDGGGTQPLELTWQGPPGMPSPTITRGAPCATAAAILAGASMTRFVCPAAASGAALVISGIDPATQLLVGASGGARAWTAPTLLTGSASYELPGGADYQGLAAARAYFNQGAVHVLGGTDHLLFLGTLLLLARRPRGLIAVATLFTVGHSITLGLAAGGAMTLDPRLAEVAIALTLVVAARQLWLARDDAALQLRRLATTALAFGLVHGLGFGGALAGIGLPPRERLLPLAAFNVGVEVGQVAALALMWSLLRLHGADRAALVARTVSLVVGTAGVYWCLERI